MKLQKLRIHAILQRTLELEFERIEKYKKPFKPEPIEFKEIKKPFDFKNLYDKNGKLFEAPKSKFHK